MGGGILKTSPLQMVSLSFKTKCVEEFSNDNWSMIIFPTTTTMQYLDRLLLLLSTIMTNIATQAKHHHFKNFPYKYFK
jgi:hypothetical protein